MKKTNEYSRIDDRYIIKRELNRKKEMQEGSEKER
jgi:hypothetical protein